MRIRFWGVRGSIPTPLTTAPYQARLFEILQRAQDIDLSDPASIRRYIASLPAGLGTIVGGNTTCIEVDLGDNLVIIDAGSGLRELGNDLMRRGFGHGHGRGHGRGHLLLTHAHWDHLQGFPFFAPLFVPGNHFTVYTVENDPRQFLDHQQVAPRFFPIPVSMLKADLDFVTLAASDTLTLGDTRISTIDLYHPGTAWALRFDAPAGSFVFASDGEYNPLDKQALQRYIDFYRNADVLVFDTQYALKDVITTKTDWGHSSVAIGVDIAQQAGVKTLVTFHHDHADNDDRLVTIAAEGRDYATLTPDDATVDVQLGHEGLEIIIGDH